MCDFAFIKVLARRRPIERPGCRRRIMGRERWRTGRGPTRGNRYRYSSLTSCFEGGEQLLGVALPIERNELAEFGFVKIGIEGNATEANHNRRRKGAANSVANSTQPTRAPNVNHQTGMP